MKTPERERLLRMYQQGFTAGRESERRNWLDAAPADVLLHRVIGVLADALNDKQQGDTA